jgi:hypothetical protein
VQLMQSLRCFESEQEVLIFASASHGVTALKGCRSIASRSCGSLLECIPTPITFPFRRLTVPLRLQLTMSRVVNQLCRLTAWSAMSVVIQPCEVCQEIASGARGLSSLNLISGLPLFRTLSFHVSLRLFLYLNLHDSIKALPFVRDDTQVSSIAHVLLL